MILLMQIIRLTGPNIPDAHHARSPTSESRRRHRFLIIIIVIISWPARGMNLFSGISRC